MPTPTNGSFQLVAQHKLDGRGANGSLAIAGRCAYVGSRYGENVSVLMDITDPTQLSVRRRLPFAAGTMPLELRAVEELGLLVVMTDIVGALHLYDIHDCQNPKKVGEFVFNSTPHEFFLWRDPQNPARLLAYVAMFNWVDGLHVVDLSEPRKPSLLLTWNIPNTNGLLHSISLSDDGRRAYISNWSGGFVLADTSDLAVGKPKPQIRALGLRSYERVTTHSAVRVPGRAILVITDEIFNCPFGWVHMMDIHDDDPRVIGDFRLPENDSDACASGTFTAHNPLPTHDFVLVSWYHGGLVMLDIADVTYPRLIAQFRPEHHEQFWSYPIIKNGLIYVVSLEGGLYVLAYEGLYADQIRKVKWAEGNVNCWSACE